MLRRGDDWENCRFNYFYHLLHRPQSQKVMNCTMLGLGERTSNSVSIGPHWARATTIKLNEKVRWKVSDVDSVVGVAERCSNVQFHFTSPLSVVLC